MPRYQYVLRAAFCQYYLTICLALVAYRIAVYTWQQEGENAKLGDQLIFNCKQDDGYRRLTQDEGVSGCRAPCLMKIR